MPFRLITVGEIATQARDLMFAGDLQFQQRRQITCNVDGVKGEGTCSQHLKCEQLNSRRIFQQLMEFSVRWILLFFCFFLSFGIHSPVFGFHQPQRKKISLFSCKILQYVQQLVTNCVCLLFSYEQVEYGGFIRAFFFTENSEVAGLQKQKPLC